MRLNLNTANRNVVHHAAHANCAVLCGHSADRVVAATKRLLGRKRQSDPALYKPAPSDATSSSSQAGDTPAPVWATLVITRALSS